MTATGDRAEEAQIVIPPALDPMALRPLDDARVVRFGGETMGTGWSLAAALPPGMEPAPLRAACEGGFERIIAQMSQWEAGSELSRYNAAAAGTRHRLSPQFAIVLQMALEIAQASDGAFDPTVGALSDAWGFGAADWSGLAAWDMAARPDWRRVAFDGATRELVQPGGLTLDLSAIAKGFAVDYTAAILKRAGVDHALVEIGGELRAQGVRPDGLPWWVDLERAPGDDGAPVRIALSGWSIATTGHYLRRRSAGSESWSHSIDPNAGRPISDDIAAVSVLHPHCMQADALATAIAVMGVIRGLDFAERRRLPVRIVAEGAVRASEAWRAYCEEA